MFLAGCGTLGDTVVVEKAGDIIPQVVEGRKEKRPRGAKRIPVPARCPQCKGPLTVVDNPAGFGCEACNLLYKTEDEIPNFLIDEAVTWREEGD